jgi:hypothetical protein
MKMLKGAIGAFILLLVPSLLMAAAPSVVTTPQITSNPVDRTATIKWTMPTLYTDGSPITEVVSVNVYEGLCSATTLTKVATTTALTAVRTVTVAGAWCWQLSAQTPNGGESALTARGSKTFLIATPNTTPTFSVE